MADVFSKTKRSQVMSRIRSSGNLETEIAMIKLFRVQGITGWRRGQVLCFDAPSALVRVRPDFLFRKKKVALFVDGEFWHGHPTRAKVPKTRRAWWREKIANNKKRDRRQNRALQAAGWRVVRVWQFEIKTPIALKKLRTGSLL